MKPNTDGSLQHGERPHVCIVTTAHPADDVRVNNKFAQSFVQEGFKVSWVGPEFVFFDEKKTKSQGVEFHFYKREKGRLGRLQAARLLLHEASKIKNVDVYYAPEPDSAEVAVKLAERFKAKSIFDIHEVYHDAHLRFGLWGGRLFRPLLAGYIKKRVGDVCARCDLVIGVNESVMAPYRSKAAETMVVRSCAPRWFAQRTAAQVGGRDSLTMMHGKSNLSRGTAEVLDAVSRASREVDGLKVIMFESFTPQVDGFGKEQFKARICNLDIENAIDLRPTVPMQEMPGILRACDVGLIAYGRGLGDESLPNRLFEYLATGIPVIAPNYSKHIASIVDQEQCGMLVDFEEPDSVARAIVYLRNNLDVCKEMGKRAREGFEKRHNWESEVKPLIGKIYAWKSALNA